MRLYSYIKSFLSYQHITFKLLSNSLISGILHINHNSFQQNRVKKNCELAKSTNVYFEMIAHKVALNYKNKKFKCRRNEYLHERVMTPKKENKYPAFFVLLNYLRRNC